MSSGNAIVCLGILGVAIAISASVWYPIQRLTEQLNSMVPGENVAKRPRDCFDVQNGGFTTSGVYVVYPGNTKKGFEVNCDMDTDSGGWLVFQQRLDGSEDFKQDWGAYQFGFGNINSEFWLGNEYIHLLTNSGWYEMYVEMEDFEGEIKFAKYRLFHVASRDKDFQLTVGGYSGTAGDSLSAHSGTKFSTVDKDNDQSPGSCATTFKGGWWYTNCLTACLNGQYLGGEHESNADGINWYLYKGYKYSLKRTRMMLRPV